MGQLSGKALSMRKTCDPHVNRGQSFDQYGYARLPVPNDIVHGHSIGGCGCNVWLTASPPPVSGVHWSSGFGTVIEPFTIVLGEPIGSGMCYGGGDQPTERCGTHDDESSNSGTIRNVVESDVVGNAEHWYGSRGFSVGRGRKTFYDTEGTAGSQIHDSDGPVAPSVGSGCYRAVAGVDLPFLHEMRVFFWQKRAIDSVTMLT